eukprot:9529393-Ditylum_brightwellii.AAC.1
MPRLLTKTIFKSQNNPIDVDAEHIDSKEDNLQNFWKDPPCSVYSCTATTKTAESSINSMTQNEYNITSQVLQDIVKCTETIKNEYKKDNASLREL